MRTDARDKRPDILMIGPGPDEVGGVSTFVQFILQSRPLNQRFSIIHMYTGRGPGNQASAGQFSLLNFRLLSLQLRELFMTLQRSRPRIVHLNITAGWSFWKTAMFMLMSHAFHARTVSHIHGGDFNLFFDGSSAITRKLITGALQASDAVVVLSTWWSRYIGSATGHRVRTAVIPNAPSESLSGTRDSAGSPRPHDGNTVLFVGSLGWRKGVFDLLKAIPLVLEKCPSARFVFLGEEEVSGEKELILRACRAGNLEEHVHFAGWVIGEEKCRYLEQADIFVLPSHAENLPYALLEAMGMGLPAVTTPVGGIPEVIEDGREGYLVQPGNEHEIADRIVRLLGNPVLRAELGRNGRRKIQEKYSAERVAKQWASLYEGLLHRSDSKQGELACSAQ